MAGRIEIEDRAVGAGATLSGIRIARVSTVPFFVAAQLKLQIAALGRLGAQVSVVTSDEPELASLQGLEGVRCVPINIPRAISPWHDLLALIRLARFCRKERIQIAHSTTPKAGLLTALAAFVAGVPLRLHTFTGQPWVNMRGPKRWLLRSCDRLIGRLNSRCYADSASQRRFLVEQGIIEAGRISVVGAGSLAGVDVQRFDRHRISAVQGESLRRELNIPEKAPVVLYLGRITVDKGVRELLQAFEALKAAGSAAHLLLVGRFDVGSGVSGAISPHDVERLRDAHFVKYTESPESYMAIADVLCLPSYREGFGTVVIEAAAMGVPAVGTEIYGLTDAIVPGETGLLVPPRNVSELLAALKNILDDGPLRARMGEAARQRARALFDAADVNRLVIDEYCGLLAKTKVSR